jgi:hypothetical protein
VFQRPGGGFELLDIMKLTENEKNLAYFLATFLRKPNGYFEREKIEGWQEILSSKKLFLKICAVFFDNSGDFLFIDGCIRSGLNYIVQKPEQYSQLVSALNNKFVSKELKAMVMEELSKPEPLPFKKKKQPPKPTKIYLMVDERTGYHKIGRSVNPTNREKTLQSDNPKIRLLECWETTSDNEKTLHVQFHDKRVRGEWFALTDSDIEQIRNHFKGTK